VAQIGGSIEEMHQLRAALEREAQTVAQVAGNISNQVNGTMWTGPAADRFRGQWDGEFRPALNNLQQALSVYSQEVARHAEALMRAGG
jgi:WXG100 family type VII secretion target